MNEPLVLSIEPPNPTVDAGTETHAFLKLHNDTPAPFNLRLVVDGPQAAWVVPTPDTIEVPPNGEATAALLLQPPAGATPAPYLLTLYALNQADGSAQAQLSFALTVQAVAGAPAPIAVAVAVPVAAAISAAPAAPAALLLTVNLSAQSSPTFAEYLIQVGNPTATATTAELHAVDETNRLALVIDPPQVMLPAQGQAQATLHVTANAPLNSGEAQRTHTITVQAASADTGQVSQASATFVQTQTSGLMSKLPLILAAMGIGLLVLAVLFLFRDRSSEDSVANPTVILQPMTAVPTQAQIVITAEPLPTADVQPTLVQPTLALENPTVPVVQPSPIVETPVQLPATTEPGAPADGTFAVTAVAVTVQPQTSAQCPTTFLFTAQVTASGTGRVQYQWVFSNGQNPPPAVMEFRSAGTAVAQVDLQLTESGEGWGQMQFTDPVFQPSNQATYILNCAPAPPNAVPATATP